MSPVPRAAFVPGSAAPLRQPSAGAPARAVPALPLSVPTTTAARLSSAAFPPVLELASALPASSLSTPAATSSEPVLLPEFALQFTGFRGAPAPGSGAARGTALLWFRCDLRLHDHAALAAACEEAGSVLPCYIFDPRQFGKTAFGFEKTGRYRAKFLIESVTALREALGARGSVLAVRQGEPEKVLVELCRAYGVNTVYFHQEVTYEEQEVEQAVEKALRAAGVEIRKLWANTLYQVEDLPFRVEAMPDVYTEFRQAVETKAAMRAPLDVPEVIPAPPKTLDEGHIPTLQQLGLSEPAPEARPVGSGHTFVGGEREALERLRSYVLESQARWSAAGRSAGDTNTHFSAQLGADFSCKISPWLAVGCVSPRRILADLKQYSAAASGQILKSTTYFELVWRDFFRFITLKYGAARLNKAGTRTTTANAVAC